MDKQTKIKRTYYLTKETVKALQHCAVDAEMDLSELLEKIISEYTKKKA